MRGTEKGGLKYICSERVGSEGKSLQSTVWGQHQSRPLASCDGNTAGYVCAAKRASVGPASCLSIYYDCNDDFSSSNDFSNHSKYYDCILCSIM